MEVHPAFKSLIQRISAGCTSGRDPSSDSARSQVTEHLNRRWTAKNGDARKERIPLAVGIRQNRSHSMPVTQGGPDEQNRNHILPCRPGPGARHLGDHQRHYGRRRPLPGSGLNMAFHHRWFGRPSQKAFARLMTQELLRRDPMLTVHPDLDTYRLVLRRGRHRESDLNLALSYAEFCQAGPLERSRILNRWCALPFVERQDMCSLDEAIPRLLPRVRERFFYELNALLLRTEQKSPLRTVRSVLAESLAVSIVQDFPEAMVDVQEEHLESWQVPWDTLMTHARRNLRERSQRAFEKVSPGLFRSPWKDNHDAARMLLLDLMRGLDLKGEPVAMAPHRDQLLVAGDQDRRALAKMAELALATLQKPRAMTGQAFRLGPEGWEPWLPGADKELRAAYLMLREHSHLLYHSEQRDLLQEMLNREGREAFVPQYRVFVDPQTQVPFSTAAFPRRGETWLPRTDQVGLLDVEQPEGKQLRQIPWKDLEQKLEGALVQEPGLWPARYRLEGWEGQFPE